MPEKDLETVANFLHVSHYPMGATVVEQGAQIFQLGIVSFGRCAVFHHFTYGNDKVVLPLAQLQQGDYFGEQLIRVQFNKEQGSHISSFFTIKALEPTEIGYITGQKAKCTIGILPYSMQSQITMDPKHIDDYYERYVAKLQMKIDRRQLLTGFVKEWKKDPTGNSFKDYVREVKEAPIKPKSFKF